MVWVAVAPGAGDGCGLGGTNSTPALDGGVVWVLCSGRRRAGIIHRRRRVHSTEVRFRREAGVGAGVDRRRAGLPTDDAGLRSLAERYGDDDLVDEDMDVQTYAQLLLTAHVAQRRRHVL